MSERVNRCSLETLHHLKRAAPSGRPNRAPHADSFRRPEHPISRFFLRNRASDGAFHIFVFGIAKNTRAELRDQPRRMPYFTLAYTARNRSFRPIFFPSA